MKKTCILIIMVITVFLTTGCIKASGYECE